MNKKILLFSSIALSATNLYAQITVTQSDAPSPGTIVVNAYDTLPDASIIPGGTGMQTWDYSLLHNHASDTTFFIDPATTAYASYFPAATVAFGGGGGVVYALNSASDFENLGFVGLDTAGNPIIIPFNDPQVLMQYPATYGTAFSDASNYSISFPVANVPFVDSIRIAHSSLTTNNFDAYGMVTTPLGTFNCLRMAITDSVTDSIFAHSTIFSNWVALPDSLQPGSSTTYSYSFWANAMGSALVTLNMDTSNYSVVSASWINGTLTSVKDNATLKYDFSVYPNPATDILHISNNYQGESFITVYDDTGRKIFFKNISERNAVLDTHTWKSGIYFYSISQNAKILSSGKISINN